MGKSEIKVPKVADGYFFRVSRKGVLDGYVRVELRKNIPDWIQDFLWDVGITKDFSVRIRSKWSFAHDTYLISDAMKTLWEKHAGKPDPDSTYVGDYL